MIEISKTMEHKILVGDCFDLIKEMESSSVDLVITSPPYADIINYGKKVSVMKVDEYVEWLLPLFFEVHRVLKDSGSFILNINDRCVNGYKSTFIFDLISMNNKKSPLKMYDYYIWYKKASIPNGSDKRFRNNTEWLFHFCKDRKKLKFNMSRVMLEPKESSKERFKYDMKAGAFQGVTKDGIRKKTPIKVGIDKSLPEMIRPDSVFRFNHSGASRENTIGHPAPFHKELPKFFIELLTDEGDLILDTFSGIGTTSIAALELNRKSIGFELNDEYAEFSMERIKQKLGQI